jgi:hypothetical protein
MPAATGLAPCMVNWQDSFIVFGGYENNFIAELYNISTQVFMITMYMYHKQEQAFALWLNEQSLKNCTCKIVKLYL